MPQGNNFLNHLGDGEVIGIDFYGVFCFSQGAIFSRAIPFVSFLDLLLNFLLGYFGCVSLFLVCAGFFRAHLLINSSGAGFKACGEENLQACGGTDDGGGISSFQDHVALFCYFLLFVNEEFSHLWEGAEGACPFCYPGLANLFGNLFFAQEDLRSACGVGAQGDGVLAGDACGFLALLGG